MPIENVPNTDLQYYLLAFDADGRERAEAGGKLSRRIIDVLAQEPVTDVFLMSHGWMGDLPAARRQYTQWIGAMAAAQADIARLRERRPGFRPLLIGLHWPSLPWGDEELAAAALAFGTAAVLLAPLIEQYAERLADTEPARQALQTIFQAALEDTGTSTLPTDVRDAYRVLDREAALSSDGEGGAPGADREPFDPQALFDAAEDDAVSFGGLSGLSSGLLAPLRALSFWKMKDRARRFGESGGFELLTALQRAADPAVRFHLMGHSFGCIVVSACIVGPPGGGEPIRPVHSLALVQGALSLWSYGADIPVAPGRPGYFHRLLGEKRVAGPILTTQSQYDFAVGRFYPLAAGLRRQIDFAPGELPRYGALGAFGAQGSGIAVEHLKMLPTEAPYAFEPGRLYNLDASQFIAEVRDPLQGAHSDIARPEVAHAVWSAAG